MQMLVSEQLEANMQLNLRTKTICPMAMGSELYVRLLNLLEHNFNLKMLPSSVI